MNPALSAATRSRHTASLLAALATLALGSGCGEVASDPEILARLPGRVDFNFHVKPLLSDRCYACHGPDARARKAGLRLDDRETVLESALESGARAVVPGSLWRSELWSRISSDDPDHRMPPSDSKRELSPYEVALIGRWIEQGAEWKPHWAFIAPERTPLPEVEQESWPRNPIDRFVLARLEREGLSPSPEAERERLIRRVSFDLTGLPPTLEEVDAFLADDSPDAYERVAERLLDSPAYAERMALDWLDLARYADSHGLHADGYRNMWPWRDWVIQAFADNVPYDRFLTWQLAGDLLPDPSREQILATAFQRNHPMTAEGGVIDEEFRLEYVFDRATTTARGLMGLTLECARCHDHKFDPIAQREFYELAAFFNNVRELGMTGDDGNAGPLLPLPEPEVDARLAELEEAIAALEARLAARRDELRGAELPAPDPGRADRPGRLVAHYPLDAVFERPSQKKREPGAPPQGPERRTANLADPARSARVRGEPPLVEGVRGSGMSFGKDYDILDLEDVGLFERTEPFTIALWVRPRSDEPYRVLLGTAGEKNGWWRGWELFLDGRNRLSGRINSALPHNSLHVRGEVELPDGEWSHVALSYDGSSRAAGLRLFVDGREPPRTVLYDRLYKSILPIDTSHRPVERPVRVGQSYRSFTGDNGIFTGAVDEIRIHERRLTAAELLALADPEALDALATRPGESWSDDERALALDHHLHRGDAGYRTLRRDLERLRREQHALMEPVPEVMVMEEMTEPRPMHVLERGAYDAPRERVAPATPRSVLPFPEDLPRDRLGLVQWLLSPEHPLTARVTVNRYWQLHFGKGLVETTEDFGYQGALPTHPELLDWLAVEFRESGWDVKALNRLIVTSATYRQSSIAGPELQGRDPRNELLARGPSHRLAAEMIRDNALAASGLLARRIGGPSARPYQPPGLWKEKGVFSKMLLEYVPDEGEGLYRRSLYTFIKRTSPPPAMMVFDATSRSDCVVRRQSTSSPLQALVLMNDPQYVEAARVLAERMLSVDGDEPATRIAHGFRLATSRRPRPEELSVLGELYTLERARFAADAAGAEALLGVGERPPNPRFEPGELASMTMVASTLLNHDESWTKR